MNEISMNEISLNDDNVFVETTSTKTLSSIPMCGMRVFTKNNQTPPSRAKAVNGQIAWVPAVTICYLNQYKRLHINSNQFVKRGE